MSTLVQITALPHELEDHHLLLNRVIRKSNIRKDDIGDWRIRKRSIDARKKPVDSICKSKYGRYGEEKISIPPYVPQRCF